MEHNHKQDTAALLDGVDVGSTTTKVAAVDTHSGALLYFDYQRHGAAQLQSVAAALKKLHISFPGTQIRLALTGSGAKGIAELLHVPYIQEVVANSIALRRRYPRVRTAIELGGQDAKIIFFRKDEGTGALTVADMRRPSSAGR